ncbi:sugar ABC transporter permease [Cohnella xylanilytica]|uniref:Sugar ABC transporter permease n=1 Tax=Cohnella xylanilytica TaxID=557555 RepID=A0A841TY83_9BACL|nr:ABC transporter permease subunit [Cohnella xylanilytica]MBB6690881.1 sugar ABC transporter permease [Cohnella xylanilytica]GIO15706.1 sugar ABC transporter permease [Cohnella xylanilytica]
MAIAREIAKNKYLYLLAVPGLLFLLVFAYVPMAGHLIAFKKYRLSDGLWGSKWVGFDNFKFFFMSSDWYTVTFNTIFLNGLFIVCGLGIALILAIFLNEIASRLYKKIAQSFIFMPYFISWLVVSMMVFAFLNTTDGILNRTLAANGLEPRNWYLMPGIWPAVLTIVYVWKFAGYYSIIFLAAIAGISGEYYESARIDGATRFQQIVHITIPLIRNVLIVLALLGVGRIFYGDFGMIYGIVGDTAPLYPTTDVIDTYSYRALRQLGDFSKSSAVILYQSVMGLVTIVIFNAVAKKIDPDSSLF